VGGGLVGVFVGGYAGGFASGLVATAFYGGNAFQNALVGGLSSAIIATAVYGAGKGVVWTAQQASRGIDAGLENLAISVNKRAESVGTTPLPFEDPRSGDWYGNKPSLRYTEEVPGGIGI
jgi:hypothetical protein